MAASTNFSRVVRGAASSLSSADTSRRGGLVTYEVRHPLWRTYPVRDLQLEWDWGAVYGPEWADLGELEPASVVLAEGSPVAVSPC